MKNCFEILGIEPTEEVKKIKKAYAAKVREYHPEEFPEEFQVFHDAYKQAVMAAQKLREMRDVPEKSEDFCQEIQEETEMESSECQAYSNDSMEIFGRLPEEEEKLWYQSEWEIEPALPGRGVNIFADLLAVANSCYKTAAEEPVYLYEEYDFAKKEIEMTEGEIARNVCLIIETCRGLYEEESGVYRETCSVWKNLFHTQNMKEVFKSGIFIVSWYQFLESHHMFKARVWNYFEKLDGELFSPDAYGIVRFPYKEYRRLGEDAGKEREREIREKEKIDIHEILSWIAGSRKAAGGKGAGVPLRTLVYILLLITAGFAGLSVGTFFGALTDLFLG